MRFSPLRAAALALLGLTLRENGSNVSAELPKWDIPSVFGPANTLILNIERSKDALDVKELLSVAHNLHVKFDMGKQESYEFLFDHLLVGVSKVKEEESRSWNPFTKVHPVTVVVEPSDRDYLANGPAGVDLCLKDLRFLDDLLWSGFASQPGQHHLSSWGISEGSTPRAISVLFSAAIPEGCFEKFPVQQQRKVKDKNGQEVKMWQDVYIGLNPHITTESDIDLSKDKVQGVQLITRDWPNGREVLGEYLKRLPGNSRLRLANTPLDLNTHEGRFAQRVMAFHGGMGHNRLLYSVQLPAKDAEDIKSDDTKPPSPAEDSDDIQPITPTHPTPPYTSTQDPSPSTLPDAPHTNPQTTMAAAETSDDSEGSTTDRSDRDGETSEGSTTDAENSDETATEGDGDVETTTAGDDKIEGDDKCRADWSQKHGRGVWYECDYEWFESEIWNKDWHCRCKKVEDGCDMRLPLCPDVFRPKEAGGPRHKNICEPGETRMHIEW